MKFFNNFFSMKNFDVPFFAYKRKYIGIMNLPVIHGDFIIMQRSLKKKHNKNIIHESKKLCEKFL